MKRAIVILAIIAVVGAGAGAYYMRRGGGELQVNSSPITRGEIIDTVGSTGTLQAVTTVQVGSQVSGNISWLGADFNSIVKKGQVIARLDPSLFQAQVDQANANLIKAQADVVRSQADVDRSKVALVDANQKYARARELNEKKLVTQADLDSAKVAVDSAQSAVQSSQASFNSSQAVVTQSRANLNQAQLNLDHCTITAPIDGIVIQRSVDVGQTVAASMQAPTLFIIAADLTKMQVNANIDEADVGRIRPNQTVTFRVDAYPAEEFQGSVSQIRLQPVVVQNVTTYATIINVPNSELKLKPGMTANLRVQIARRPDVLRIANAALRFRPTNEMFSALNQPVPQEMLGGGRGGRGRRNASADTAAPQAGPQTGSTTALSSAAKPQPSAPAAPSAASRASPSGSPRDDGGQRNFDRGQGGFGGSGGGGFGGRGQGGFGGGGFGGGGFGGGDGGDRQARMLERFKSMSPDEQKQFIERIKGRGGDTSVFEKAVAPAPKRKGEPASQTATTIDALFAPLPTVERSGRAWLYVDKQLKPVNLRTGITDGTNTEVVSDDLQPGTEVVTGIVLPSSARPAAAAAGNPFQQGGGNRGGNFGGFPGGGGGGRGR
jgi:HlyD family secretion protein